VFDFFFLFFLTSDAQVLVTRPPDQTADQAEERFPIKPRGKRR